MRLAHVHQLPVILAGHGIEIAAAQKANIVGLHQLIDGRGEGAELLVVQLDRTLVLQPALDRFLLAISLDRFGDARRGDGEREQ
jgi:hypothetical protein